jgi:hypothetical protein
MLYIIIGIVFEDVLTGIAAEHMIRCVQDAVK